MVSTNALIKRRMFGPSLPHEEWVILNFLMMAKRLKDKLLPAVIRVTLKGTRNYLP